MTKRLVLERNDSISSNGGATNLPLITHSYQTTRSSSNTIGLITNSSGPMGEVSHGGAGEGDGPIYLINADTGGGTQKMAALLSVTSVALNNMTTGSGVGVSIGDDILPQGRRYQELMDMKRKGSNPSQESPQPSPEGLGVKSGYQFEPPASKGRPRKHPYKPGKYQCKYCGALCAKPSVLQKHVRAHTNERPYPCRLCNIDFKTKSNLSKHEKSKAHLSMRKSSSMSASDEIDDDNGTHHLRHQQQGTKMRSKSVACENAEKMMVCIPGFLDDTFQTSNSDTRSDIEDNQEAVEMDDMEYTTETIEQDKSYLKRRQVRR